MENIKTKRIRGRPSVKKMVETIEEQIKGQEKSNIELVIDEPVESTNNFLDELNNENFNQGLYHVEEEDEYEEDSDDVIEEIPEEQNDDEPSYQSIAFINKLNLQRADNNIKPKNNIQKHRKQNDDDEDIFSKKGTPIQGEIKLHLLSKITQYKQLFPKELKSFKIKKNCDEIELQDYLTEIEVIISINSVDKFITDSILQSIKMGEGLSSFTKYDISGLSDILKSNEHFHSLAKQLYIKYGCFSKMPVESQMAMLILTSAYVCVQSNKQKKMKFMNKLSEPVLI